MVKVSGGFHRNHGALMAPITIRPTIDAPWKSFLRCLRSSSCSIKPACQLIAQHCAVIADQEMRNVENDQEQNCPQNASLLCQR